MPEGDMERHRLERTVREKEASYRSLFDAVQDAVLVAGVDRRIIDCNPACERLLGYTRQEMLGRESGFVYEDEAEYERAGGIIRDNMDAPLEQFLVSVRLRRKNGEVFDGEVNISYLRGADGRARGVIGSIRDVSEWRRVDLELREALLAKDEAVRAGHVGLWDWNLQTGVVSFSSEWKRQIGYEDHEIGAGPEEWSSRLHPDDSEDIQRRIREYIEGDTTTYEIEFRFRHKDGSYRWILAPGTIMRDQDGKAYRILGSHVDITETKQAEQALRKSEALLSDVGEMAQVGGWELEPDTGRVTWTGQTYAIHEVGPDYDPTIEPALAFYHPEDRPVLEQAIRECVERRTPYDLELRFITAKGRRLWVRSIGRAVAENGRVVRLRGTFQDITDRKQAETALQELARYPQVNPHPVLKADADGKLVYVNPAAERIHSHIADENGRLVEPLSGAVAEAVGSGEVRTVDLKAGGQWFAMSCAPLAERKEVNVYGMDITERRNAEQALREGEARYRGLFDSIRDAILVADTERNIMDCNPAFSDLFGYSLDDIRGRPTSYVYESDEEHRRMGELLREARERGEDVDRLTFLVHYAKRSGEVFPGETGIFVLRDSDGREMGFIGLIRDVTERLREDEQLRRRAAMESLLSESAMRFLEAESEGIEQEVEGMLERMCRFSGVDRCYLVMTGGQSDILCVTSEWHQEGLESLSTHLGQDDMGYPWWLEKLKSGAAIHVNDVAELPPEAQAEKRHFMARGVRSALAVPMLIKERLTGYLGLESQQAMHAWTGEDMLMLETFAGIVVSALERARAVAERDRNLKVKAALAKLYKPIVSPFANIATISRAILEQALDVTASPHGYVGSIDDVTGDLVCHTLEGMLHGGQCRVEGRDSRIVFPPGPDGKYKGLWGHSLNTGRPLVTNAPRAHPASAGLPEGHASIDKLLSVPVTLGSDVVGQITLANKAEVYDEHDVDAVRQMAEYYALALERLRSRERLDEAETRFLNVVETMHDGMVILDEAVTVSYANQHVADLLGIPLSGLIGRTIMEFMEPDAAGRMRQAMSEAERLESQALDLIWRGAAGPVHTVVSRAPVIDENGHYRGAFCIVHDLTERLRLERQLLQSQKLESIGQLAAGVAHEINTPAQYVGNNIRFLQRSVGEMLAAQRELEAMLEEAAAAPGGQDLLAKLEAFRTAHDFEFLAQELPEAVEESIEGIERISEIVRSVKQFAHPGDREKALSDLNEAVENTVVVSTNEWKYVAEMQTDLDKDLPPAPCVASEIKQVILNLIVNAAHAIADRLGDKPAEKGRITVRTRLAGEHAEISVSDSGSGIPQAVRERIFDPFFTTKAVGRGTGQGLSIAHTIVVEKHGGSIDFETEEGRGTTFTVSLPLQERESLT